MTASDSDLFGDLLGLDTSGPSGPNVITDEVTEGEMCDLLGVSASRLRQLARDGIAVRSRRGRWDWRETLRRYLPRLREQASRAGPGAKSSGSSAELHAEKLRLTKAQADKEETRVARERGDLIEVAAVTREWQIVLRDIRAAMLAVPSRFGADHPHMTPNDITGLTAEIRAALEGLADGKD